MSTTIAKANPKVGFVSLGCPYDLESKPPDFRSFVFRQSRHDL